MKLVKVILSLTFFVSLNSANVFADTYTCPDTLTDMSKIQSGVGYGYTLINPSFPLKYVSSQISGSSGLDVFGNFKAMFNFSCNYEQGMTLSFGKFGTGAGLKYSCTFYGNNYSTDNNFKVFCNGNDSQCKFATCE